MPVYQYKKNYSRCFQISKINAGTMNVDAEISLFYITSSRDIFVFFLNFAIILSRNN